MTVEYVSRYVGYTDCRSLAMRFRTLALVPALGGVLLAQEPTPNTEKPEGWRKAESAAGTFAVPLGTKIPLGLINSISTKNAAEGDRVYLETVFPILSNGRIVIPPG